MTQLSYEQWLQEKYVKAKVLSSSTSGHETCTTGTHSANDILHSAKPLLSVILDKEYSETFIGKDFFAEYFFRTLDKDFTECQKTLGKEKHSAN
jgi:hypothetical protein